MYRIGIALLFLLGVNAANAQYYEPAQALKTYQSAENKWYWKNRKPGSDYWQQDVSYHITARLNDTTEIITGHERLVYANNAPDTLYRLYFRLTQNAFQPGSYKDRMERGGKVFHTFGKYEKQGLGTRVTRLKINGQEAEMRLDNTILMVQLATPLLPGNTLTIDMDFETYFDQGSMGRRMKRFEHNNYKHFDGVHWYPRISVYDRKFKWTTDQHLGKEFYGDYGVYKVELLLPNHYICEATGLLQNKEEVYANGLRQKIDISNFKEPSPKISTPVIPDGTYKRWIWFAENVHDFAFTTDPTYRIGEVTWKGISCIALAQEQNAHKWQPTAQFVAGVVKTYSEDIGMYLYPKMVAADARDGMEYPMLTLDGGNWPGHQYVIAHEIGHNWFFGMVGNNETYRAALDEGFTQFLTAWSMKKLGKKDYFPNPVDWAYVYAGYVNHAINENTARLNIHSDHFNSAERHGGGYGQVYYKTATMLYNLEYVLGEKLFLEAIQYYFDKWKLCHPYEEDFRQAVIDYTKTDLNWFFDAWLTTTETIDYKVGKVKKIKSVPNTYAVRLKRKGAQSMPLDITVITKKGTVLSYVIPNTYFAKEPGKAKIEKPWITWDMMNRNYTLKVETPEGIRNVLIDTSRRLADLNRLNNSMKLPYSLKAERLTIPPADFNLLQNYWRPEIWWNKPDGLKVGVHVSGHYYNFRHIYSATIWYNTGIETDRQWQKRPALVDFAIQYKTRIGKMLDFNFRTQQLERISLFETGLEKQFKNHKFKIYYKAFGQFTQYFSRNTFTGSKQIAYRLYPESMADNLINATLNLGYNYPFKYKLGNGNLQLGIRNTALLSDFSYSGVHATLFQSNPVGTRMVLKSRIFAQYLHGNIAGESRLQLAGANTEDLLENKFTRTRGWIPESFYGMGATGAYPLHMGGGLNLRGMAGYQASNNKDGDTFLIYQGNKGLALNLELEFGKWFKVKPGKWNQWFRMNPYLFADAGILGNGKRYSGLRADAGLGSTVTLGFGKYNRLQPLVLRFDFPLVINRVDEGSDYVAFRYLVGINRAF